MHICFFYCVKERFANIIILRHDKKNNLIIIIVFIKNEVDEFLIENFQDPIMKVSLLLHSSTMLSVKRKLDD